MEYADLVTRLFTTPPNLGPLADADCHGEARESGAWIVIEARVRDRRLEAVAFQALACPHVIAAAALAADRLRGQPVDALGTFDPWVLRDELALPTEKRGRLLTLQDALRNCFRDWDTTQSAGRPQGGPRFPGSVQS